ncbi:hypothetical protein L210DRAFT_106310 [Boletus edulis BED1]|uniref:Uncharacterized protein n=1 Tax=Boletus edulis BED1 TaxID=1328754 RepID=A0AAD4BP04_BOLED|nr:hypothetical protein L210DRAFT_106310 [Boletus edulis BED1]
MRPQESPSRVQSVSPCFASAGTSTGNISARTMSVSSSSPCPPHLNRSVFRHQGPWLQLPLELLESLLVLNTDPAALSGAKPHSQTLHSSRTPHSPHPALHARRPREVDRGLHALSDHTPPDSPRRNLHPLPSSYTTVSTPPLLSIPGKPTPPPIDPGVFRNVAIIRRLIDEAAELSVRASSGLSSAALGSMRGGSNGAWPTAQSLGLDAFGNMGGGRNVAMSAMRVHRLRALAVQKLAAAYKADEIASSVMVMQGGSVFDDIAERVLRHDPNDTDAKYVHFFHEKIPSRANRQLAESTTTQVLDELIAVHPQRLEYYRTRGIVHCFRDEYTLATKDFTYALKEARSARKGRTAHRSITLPSDSRGKNGKKKKGSNKSNGQAPPNGTSDSPEGSIVEGPDGEPLLVHPSVSPNAPDPIEPQLLFLRGATYLQHALYLIESAIVKLEHVSKPGPASDGAELRLCYLANGRYGGVEIGNPDGPLGRSDGPKARAYRGVLGEESFREDIYGFLRKCIRDHERFLSHFDTLEGGPPIPGGDVPADLAKRVEIAFLLSELSRPGSHSGGPAGLAGAESLIPPMFTTYHPLLVESRFSILICQFMLGELPTLLTTFARSAVLVDALEGYPIFLPPRSMAQAEFIEVLERLASGWKVGIQPHSVMRAGSVSNRRAIEAPPVSPSNSLFDVVSSSSSGDTVDSFSTPFASTSSAPKTTRASSLNHVPGRDGPSASAIKQGRVDLVEALDCARILLVPVAARQKERACQAAADKANKKKPLNINIPLHGPRVEIILAWLAAVHLVEFESVA